MEETAAAIRQIGGNVATVNEKSLTQAAGVTETAATIEQINGRLNRLVSEIRLQTESINKSSSLINDMVENVPYVGKTLTLNNELVKTIYIQTKQGKEGAKTANEVVKQIAERSEALLEASQIIQNIASQTNLLAMNSAIEAAYAGESGKGFAVVADEIRKLAEESNMQGKQISVVLKETTQIIKALIDAGEGAEKVFVEVYELVSKISEQEELIENAMRIQETDSEKVLAAIAEINSVTQNVTSGSEEMLQGGIRIAEEMQRLAAITRETTNSMNEIAAGGEQINKAVQDVNTITQKNKQSIDSLSEEVGKFKV